MKNAYEQKDSEEVRRLTSQLERALSVVYRDTVSVRIEPDDYYAPKKWHATTTRYHHAEASDPIDALKDIARILRIEAFNEYAKIAGTIEMLESIVPMPAVTIPKKADGPIDRQQELLDAALLYASKGWKVLPLEGKQPRIPGGARSASSDPELIRQWWSRWPYANIGVCTGTVREGYGSLVVIDIDLDRGGDKSWADLLSVHPEGVPRTLKSITGGGGFHLFFRSPTPVKSSINKIAPGIDVHGEDGYVVMPPSLHPNGHRYEWSSDPFDTSLADMPSTRVIDR